MKVLKLNKKSVLNISTSYNDAENRYRVLFEHAFDGILIYSPLGIILDANTVATTHLGYAVEELKQLNIVDLFVADDLSKKPLNLECVIAGNHVLDFRRAIKKDGSYITLEIGTSRLPDGNFMAIGRDVTGRNKFEEQRSLAASIINFSDDAIFSKSLNGKITSWNKAAEKLFGFTESEVIGKDLRHFIPHECRHEEEIAIEKILSGSACSRYETERITKNGRRINVSYTMSLLKNARGQITGISKIGRDITDEHAAAHKLAVSEKNLKAIFDNSTEGFLLMDPAGIVVAGNSNARWVWKQYLQKSLSEGASIFDVIAPSRKEIFKEMMLRVLKGETIQYQLKFDLPGDLESWVHFTLTPVRNNHEIDGICLTGKNITQEKLADENRKLAQAELHAQAQRFSSILNTLPANIALLNEEGIIMDVNTAWKQFGDQNGLGANNYGIGNNYLNISAAATGRESADGKKVAKGLRALLENTTTEFVYEYPCHGPDKLRWFRLIATSLKEQNVGGAVVMHIDVSEIKKLEQQRLQNERTEQKKITRAIMLAQETERNELGRELHDNVNQLMAAVKMKLGFCLKNYDQGIPIVAECIRHVDDAIAATRRLSHRMVIPRFTDDDFQTSLRGLAETYTNDQRRVSVSLVNFKETRLSFNLKESLYRMVQEQLTNIEKHAHARRVEVALLYAEDRILLSIQDDGKGFDTAGAGKGIGLTNIIHRAETFNGTVEIMSKPGEGFTLLISIPMLEL